MLRLKHPRFSADYTRESIITELPYEIEELDNWLV